MNNNKTLNVLIGDRRVGTLAEIRELVSDNLKKYIYI